MIDLVLGAVLAKAPTFEYVDGIGKVRSSVVSHCLIQVGVPEVDMLHDASWEVFSDCVNDFR